MRGMAAAVRRDERGSMPLAMVLTIVITGLSVALTPVTLVQLRETRSTVNRTHALQAAQTGLDVAVAAIRSATSPDGAGARALLPCGPIIGSGGSEAAAGYSVDLAYYPGDPSAPGATPMSCADAKNLSKPMPRFVRLTGTGTTTGGTTVKRVIRGDYPLQSAPAPAPSATATWGPEYDADYIHPRPIVAWSPPNATEYCLDSGYSRPPAGTKPTLEYCRVEEFEDNSYQENWYYRQDLSIATVGSIMAKAPMCLDSGKNPKPGDDVTLQPCVSPVPEQQRWYHTNVYNFELAKKSGPNWSLSGLCLNVQTPEYEGSPIVLGDGPNCRSSAYNAKQTFGLYTKVGPGETGTRRLDCTAEAGYPCVRTQFMSHAWPSRCMDRFQGAVVTIECVQDPDPEKIRWNQQWRVPKAADGPTGTVGPIVTKDPGGVLYCLTVSADLAVQQTCDPRNPATNQKFTFYRNTGNEYTSYRVIDSSGRCLSVPNGDDVPDPGSYQLYWRSEYIWKNRFDTCVNNSSDPRLADRFGFASILRRQKWDAPFILPAAAPTPGPTPAPSASPIPARTFPLMNLTEL